MPNLGISTSWNFERLGFQIPFQDFKFQVRACTVTSPEPPLLCTLTLTRAHAGMASRDEGATRAGQTSDDAPPHWHPHPALPRSRLVAVGATHHRTSYSRPCFTS